MNNAEASEPPETEAKVNPNAENSERQQIPQIEPDKPGVVFPRIVK